MGNETKGSEVTPSMVAALRKISKHGCGALAGRMGQALVTRGLATSRATECSEYPLRNFGEGRYGYCRRDYVSVAYYPTAAGLAIATRTPEGT